MKLRLTTYMEEREDAWHDVGTVDVLLVYTHRILHHRYAN